MRKYADIAVAVLFLMAALVCMDMAMQKFDTNRTCDVAMALELQTEVP